MDASEAGAGIQLGPNATQVLGALGVLESVRAFAAEPDALSVHDALSGRVLTRLPLGNWMRERYHAPYLTVHRQDLHRALLVAARDDPRISLSFGRDIVDFKSAPTGVDVIAADGRAVLTDALIVADGLWSKLRARVTPCGPPMPAGKLAYRTVVPRQALPHKLAPNDVHIWLSAGAHVVHYPVRQGREVAIVAVIDGAASVEDWARAMPPDALAASPIGSFADDARALVFISNSWRMWPLQTLAPLAAWTHGAVALLGDSAHPLLPFFAQGGGLAIEDAAIVARHIATDTAPMPDRLKAYQAERKSRAERVVAASVTNGRIYHMDGGLAAARNAVLATVPPALLMRRYDWLYGWTP